MIRGHKKGFTIVELLIVIVVIAILAAITIVAYNGIQERAYNARLKSDIASIKKALELHETDQSSIPICPAGNGTTCNLNSDIVSQMSFSPILPTAQKGTYQYVGHRDTVNNILRWGVRAVDYNDSGCKFGKNMTASWFSNAPVC